MKTGRLLIACVLFLGIMIALAYAAPARTAQQRAKDIIDAVKGEPVDPATALRLVDAWCQSENMPNVSVATNAEKARFFVDWFRTKLQNKLISVDGNAAAVSARVAKEATTKAEVNLNESP